MFLPGILFHFPSVTEFISSTGAWSSAIFDEFSSLLYPILGVGIVVLLIGVVIKIFK